MEVGDVSNSFQYDVDAESVAMIDELEFLRSPAGTCYRVIEARKSPTIPGRFYLRVEKLDHDAVKLEDEGVWPLYWHERRKRKP
jgi:hypothetical protein